MQKSDSINELASALVVAQPQIKTALMDSTNPFFKSKYADLGAVWDAVREALKTNALTVCQFPDAIGPEPALTTMLIHSSGQWISGTYPLMVADKDCTPQGYGSALTYARRYGLSAVLGVIADNDDDGNAASKPSKPSATPPKAISEAAHPQMQDQPKAALTPAVWLRNTTSDVKHMAKDELDDFCETQRERMARVKTMEPDLHTALMNAIQARYAVLA